MTKTSLHSSLIALACGALLALATPSMAAMVNLKADLKASSEVPPNESKGTGSVTATFDTDSNKLSWKGTVSGLSGPVTAAHFHTADVGRNGAVAVAIIDADKGSFEGSATLTDTQAEDLMAGKWYVNIHTATHKAGEIRGQVTR
ncbi:MAG: CHRD domain-containing protein [Pseudolabrys sp.]